MKTIPSFPQYLVTNKGRIWSTHIDKFLKVNRVGAKSKTYYQAVVLYKNGKRCQRKIHHLVLETFVGFRPRGMQCRHLNGDPSDNRLENLKWGTHSENQQDSVRHGTHVNNNGERNGMSKLSNAEVREVISLCKARVYTQNEIAKLYSVARWTINTINTGKRRKQMTR